LCAPEEEEEEEEEEEGKTSTTTSQDSDMSVTSMTMNLSGEQPTSRAILPASRPSKARHVICPLHLTQILKSQCPSIFTM
jgi:CO dehydrogenase/acetyl-CoA synthase beta subunit